MERALTGLSRSCSLGANTAVQKISDTNDDVSSDDHTFSTVFVQLYLTTINQSASIYFPNILGLLLRSLLRHDRASADSAVSYLFLYLSIREMAIAVCEASQRRIFSATSCWIERSGMLNSCQWRRRVERLTR